MSRMCHIGMSKQQAMDKKWIAITNTQNQALPRMMMVMMVVF